MEGRARGGSRGRLSPGGLGRRDTFDLVELREKSIGAHSFGLLSGGVDRRAKPIVTQHTCGVHSGQCGVGGSAEVFSDGDGLQKVLDGLLEIAAGLGQVPLGTLPGQLQRCKKDRRLSWGNSRCNVAD